MASVLNPYIHFAGTAQAALDLYQEVLGGELNISRFGDFGSQDGVDPTLVMHGQLETKAGFTLMCSDFPPGMEAEAGNTVAICISGEDEAELRGYWDGLSAGGVIDTPLEKQMWGDTFGKCTDKFGVTWLVNITQAQG